MKLDPADRCLILLAPMARRGGGGAVAGDACGGTGGERRRSGAARRPWITSSSIPPSITGNRELPKVMVIVPWKKADLGDLTGRPANSLLNEVLEPVDREVFRRELRYFEALEAKPET